MITPFYLGGMYYAQMESRRAIAYAIWFDRRLAEHVPLY